MRARVGGVRSSSSGLGASICICLGAVSAWRPWRRTSADLHRRHGIKKRKRQDKHKNENEKGGCAMGGLRRNEEEPGAGGRIPSFPQTRAAPSSRPAGRECEDKAALTNLGARSHSGNSPEADAEGWIAFAQGRPQSGENSSRPLCIERVISSYMIRSEEEMTRSPEP